VNASYVKSVDKLEQIGYKKKSGLEASEVSELSPHVWRLSDRKRSPGLRCAEEGLFLAETPLLERHSTGFAVRPQADLERILDRGFGFKVSLDHVMSGLGTVASALNAGDLCRARIAAVHLRIPDLPDAFARLDMQLEDVALKLDRIAKTTAAGDWNPASGGWDSDKHPRAGTGPNPGWFAPTGGGDDNNIGPTPVAGKPHDDGRLHLPLDERNDEIGDLVEWIANAKPEDADTIRGEIKRTFDNVGDFVDGSFLRRALATVLANPDTATRQQVLDDSEFITHHDPVLTGQMFLGFALGMVPGGGGSRLIGAGIRTAEEAAAAEGTAAAEAASGFWKLGWAKRGQQIEEALTADAPETRTPPNFPVIDQWANGVATSYKSIDLTAATYQDAGRLTYRVSNYVGKLADFNGASFNGTVVEGEKIATRVLNLVVPKGSMTAIQKSALDSVAVQAKELGVTLKITPF
jgi:hypothetical protein